MSICSTPATLVREISADVCWLSEEPLDLKRKYLLKHTTKKVATRINAIESVTDINTQQTRSASTLQLNDIARISLTVQQPLVADDYSQIRSTGAFILIDQVSHQTVAAGMIRLNP